MPRARQAAGARSHTEAQRTVTFGVASSIHPVLLGSGIPLLHAMGRQIDR